MKKRRKEPPLSQNLTMHYTCCVFFSGSFAGQMILNLQKLVIPFFNFDLSNDEIILTSLLKDKILVKRQSSLDKCMTVSNMVIVIKREHLTYSTIISIVFITKYHYSTKTNARVLGIFLNVALLNGKKFFFITSRTWQFLFVVDQNDDSIMVRVEDVNDRGMNVR